MSTGTFDVISRSRSDSLGGGGIVADIFRDLLQPTIFAVGGGGSGRKFFR